MRVCGSSKCCPDILSTIRRSFASKARVELLAASARFAFATVDDKLRVVGLFRVDYQRRNRARVQETRRSLSK